MGFNAGRHVEACRFNGRVPQNIGQMGKILFNLVIAPGEEMAQIMRKYLSGLHFCRSAQALHFMIDIAAVHGPAGLCSEKHTAFNTLCLREVQQLL